MELLRLLGRAESVWRVADSASVLSMTDTGLLPLAVALVVSLMVAPAAIWPWPYFAMTMRVACYLQRVGMGVHSAACEKMNRPEEFRDSEPKWRLVEAEMRLMGLIAVIVLLVIFGGLASQ